MAEENLEQEKVVEGQTQETTEETNFDISNFNNYFKTDVDEGSLKNLIDNRSKYSEYESKLGEYEEKVTDLGKYKDDYYSLLDQFDGSKVFANENIRKLNEMTKKFPDKDPGVVTSILNTDLNQLPETQALVLADKLKNPMVGINDSDRLEALLDELGIESTEISSLESKDKYKFQKAVNQAKEELSGIKNFQAEDQGFDIEAAKKQRADTLEEQKLSLKQKWEPLTKMVVDQFKGLEGLSIKNEKGEVVGDYSYTADASFKESLSSLVEEIVDSGLEPNKENIQTIGDEVMRRFVYNNFTKIVSDAFKQGLGKQKDVSHDLQHNDKPTNTTENPVTKDKTGGKTLTEYANSK